MTTNKKTLTIGLDLGDRRHAVCVLDGKGQITAEETVPNTRETLEQLSKRYACATIAMETGTHSPWVSRLFEARGHTVYVANARKVRAISQSVTKTDEHDDAGNGSCPASDRRYRAYLRRNPARGRRAVPGARQLYRAFRLFRIDRRSPSISKAPPQAHFARPSYPTIKYNSNFP